MDSMTISVHDLTFGFGYTTILQALSITFEPGKFHAIIGPNGSGKSTLLDLIAGYTTPWSGSVSINEINVNAIEPDVLARQLATVPQEFNFDFPFPVKDTVLMGRHPYIPRFCKPTDNDLTIMRNAMRTMDLMHLEQRAMCDLSGGEKQRTVFARALAQQTPCLLLDEPTSSMDIRHALAAMEELRRLAHIEGRTVIAVLHDLNLAAPFCDAITILNKGELYAQGAPSVALTADTIMDVFGVRAEISTAANANHPVITYSSKETI